jgi:hypothetical protein
VNKETVVLNMTPGEADKVAYVLMAALHTTTMLDNERVTATDAANALFDQLGYGHHTDTYGNRVEDKVK